MDSDCELVLQFISAELDGEIQSGDRTALDAHLAGCESCRVTAQALRTQDATLRRAFATRREAATAVADRVIDQLRPAPVVAVRFAWMPVLLAAAAGFLLAVLIFQPWSHPGPQVTARTEEPARDEEKQAIAHTASNDTPEDQNEAAVSEPPEPEPSRPLVATTPKTLTQLVFAKGAVEMLPPGSDSWQALATGGSIEPGTRVRTDSTGRCEFRTPDGSEVRLNGNTELAFHTNRQLQLAEGQVWSSVAHDEDPFEIQVPSAEATVTALGTQFDLACTALATVLTVAQGSTRVDGKAGGEIVQFGEQAQIVAGAVAERHRVHDLVVATSWVHEILVMKGHDNAELANRMDDMLAQIGKAKMSYMVEKEILQLGDHCVLPLTRFIQSERSKEDSSKRANAARILAKIARPWSVEDLIKLLADDNREVRFHAAKALERLTDGQTQGLSPDAWGDAAVDARTEALARWQAWWQANKDQFPTAPFAIEPIVKDKPDESIVPPRTKS